MKKPIFISLALYSLLIVYLSLTKPSGLTDIGTWDKLAHAVAYIGFSLQAGMIANTRTQYRLWMLSFIVFGVMIEGLQSLTIYREASMADVAANICGLLVGTLIVISAKKVFTKNNKI